MSVIETETSPVSAGVAIERLDVAAYKVPTDGPESDGTYEWQSTTMVAVHVKGGGRTGLGYTYSDTATANLIHQKLANVVEGKNAMNPPACRAAMLHAVRNLGEPGIAAMAVSAVDCAIWDLKARLLEVPLSVLLGQVHDGVPVYGSGGFTSYSLERLTSQLSAWAEDGIPRVKMKVGRDPKADLVRMGAARRAIGHDVDLFIDANGAYSVKQALFIGEFARGEFGVSWFEEPRPSDDLTGLHRVRERGPAGLDVAAGEYGFTLPYFYRMIEAGAVDCLQADITRCGGVSGLLGVSALCEAAHVPLSGHCAPTEHLHACMSCVPLRHLEFFHDHARIERMLFDGFTEPDGGMLRPDLSRPGMGIELKLADAREYAV